VAELNLDAHVIVCKADTVDLIINTCRCDSPIDSDSPATVVVIVRACAVGSSDGAVSEEVSEVGTEKANECGGIARSKGSKFNPVGHLSSGGCEVVVGGENVGKS